MSLSPSGPHRDEITTCSRCGAEIMFLQSINRKTGQRGRMPVNVVVVGTAARAGGRYRGPNHGEVSYVHGEHQSHFATCPGADQFRKPR